LKLIICHRQKQGGDIGGVPWFNEEQAQPMQTVSQPPVVSYGAPETESTAAPQRPHMSQEQIEWLKQPVARASEPRPTSFNDDNYTPKQPASTYTPPAFHRLPQPRPPITNAGRTR
jgi:hypothetical protein